MTPVPVEVAKNIKNAMGKKFENLRGIFYNLLIGGKNGKKGFKNI